MARPTKHVQRYRNSGRPSVMTEEVIRKLEEVYSIGGTDSEACLFANIGVSTLYDYQASNPEFVERKKALKESPNLKARQEVIKGLEGNPEFALKYLSKKKRDEFGDNVDLTTKGEPINKIEVEIIK